MDAEGSLSLILFYLFTTFNILLLALCDFLFPFLYYSSQWTVEAQNFVPWLYNLLQTDAFSHEVILRLLRSCFSLNCIRDSELDWFLTCIHRTVTQTTSQKQHYRTWQLLSHFTLDYSIFAFCIYQPVRNSTNFAPVFIAFIIHTTLTKLTPIQCITCGCLLVS